MELAIKDLIKRYDDLLVLDSLTHTFLPNEISVILGPSGCGKTSLLNILSGLDTQYSGSVVGFHDIPNSYIFQNNRLLPWISILENITIPLKSRVRSKSDREALAYDILKKVELEKFAYYKPFQISEGMQKRAALARAFANPGSILLLDEPFSALDIKTKLLIMDLFISIQKEEKRTAIVVTHDVKEAIYIGNELIVLSQKPARIVNLLHNPLSYDLRQYQSKASAELESFLYALLLNTETTPV
ncbi:MAG TPA: ABC transporter ATP-binding protein [Spirochaetales bacterium]|nr:ABC transporter ATP-binding protein [Spirochaetales bacterium]HRV27568.1 ABC transporter ATP-binding protein [Spirochaetia bacterium]HOT58326.1 ABC transporter ATP-binding protein [Spirochaetales bacterium]HPD80068.1 ABC transporter ATP-binding protein [Spirochaetales bacterium]HQG39944.1 ABC transporter ATP-binding protein [Spirochaetales bacterium]